MYIVKIHYLELNSSQQVYTTMAECPDTKVFKEAPGPRVFTENASYSAASMCSESIPIDIEEANYTATATLGSNDDQEHTAVASDTSSDSGTDEATQQLETHCKCPCGSTDFIHCIQPPPACLQRRHSNPQQFSEVDLTRGHDNKKAKSVMRQYLQAETTRIKRLYSKFGLALFEFAKSVQAGAYQDIEKYLSRILRLRGESITSTSSFENLFDKLIDISDFINHEPMTNLMQECTKKSSIDTRRSSAIAAEKDFKDALLKFAQHRVFGHIELPVQVGMNPTYKYLKIKVEESFAKFNIKNIYDFKSVIRSLLSIPEEVADLRVVRVKEGCVEITFEVVGTVSDETFDLSIEQKRDLASNNVSMLEYAGRVHYCCCALFADEESNDVVMSLCHKMSRELTTDDTHDKEEEEHSPDCPQLLGTGNCLLQKCSYCGFQIPLCSLEHHTPLCIQRSDTSSEASSSSEDERIGNLTATRVKENVLYAGTSDELKQKNNDELKDPFMKVSDKSFEYKDGLAFQFEIPKKDLALRAVSIEDGVPKLQFTASKKVPTITEEDVATCIRLSQDRKHPECYSSRHFPIHPFSHNKYPCHSELLPEVDWQMKYLIVDAHSASGEQFQDDEQHKKVIMTCQSVDAYESENQITFVTNTANTRYSAHFSNDNICYHDEPSFLKVKEIIKLMLAAEWLRDKGVQFSKEWIEEHSSIKQEAPKPVQVKLLSQVSQERMTEWIHPSEALSTEQSQAPLSLSLAIKEPSEDKQKDIKTGFEYTPDFAFNFPGRLPPELKGNKVHVARVTINDFDFIEHLDPNLLVTVKFDNETLTLIKPVTWSELHCETQPMPCKLLEDSQRRIQALAVAESPEGSVDRAFLNIVAATAGHVKTISYNNIPNEPEIPKQPATLHKDYPCDQTTKVRAMYMYVADAPQNHSNVSIEAPKSSAEKESWDSMPIPVSQPTRLDSGFVEGILSQHPLETSIQTHTNT